MLRFRWVSVFAVCLSVTASSFAQSSNDRESQSNSKQTPVQPEKSKVEKKSKAKNASPRDQVNNRFASRSPQIGQPLPDVSAYDADGKPFKLSSLKGQYTVMVFGCLT
jgi:cytochrome oxidase Cu insertion factor (SCO1/SenC/PrrC family)